MKDSKKTIKENIRPIELGSGSTVCSDASKAVGKGPSGTFARPPLGIGNRLNDWFIPRKMEFKGWVTDDKQCSYQGLTDTEVSDFINDLQKMGRQNKGLGRPRLCQCVVQE